MGPSGHEVSTGSGTGRKLDVSAKSDSRSLLRTFLNSSGTKVNEGKD